MIRGYRLAPLLLLAFLIGAPLIALADPTFGPIVPQECNNPGGCASVCLIATTAQHVLNFSVAVAVAATAVWFMITGYMFLTATMSSSTPGLIAAKKHLTNVFIGTIIILTAWLVVGVLISVITTGQPGLPWYQICY